MMLRISFFQSHVVQVQSTQVDTARCPGLETEQLDTMLSQISESPVLGRMPFGPPLYLLSPMMISLSR